MLTTRVSSIRSPIINSQPCVSRLSAGTIATCDWDAATVTDELIGTGVNQLPYRRVLTNNVLHPLVTTYGRLVSKLVRLA
jgi:hypothetical protein